ncbi:MAG: cytochrome c family protein [Hyphomicrobiaceae bacterium]
MTQRLLLFLLPCLSSGFFLIDAKTSHANKKVHKFTGPNACAECHKQETEVWKKTHHFKTFRNMPRSKDARKIARKLGIRRIKSDSLCLGCHFTQEVVRKKTRVTAGISCESCHGPGKDWEKIHSEFSGKKNKEQESKSEATARWKLSEQRGMIRPNTLYKLAKNCYSCHVVPNEKLVNIGGHAAGSPFELLSWSQGEVRHNVWYSKGKSNKTASANRRRMMYLAGLAVEIETAIRAVGVATKKKDYAIRMAHRANNARIKLAKVARALSDVVELRKIVTLSHSAGLKLNNKKSLFHAANKISTQAQRLLSAYDGSTFAGIDKLLPGPKKYKGKSFE